MPLLPLAAVAIAPIAACVLLVCAAHVPGLRVLVGAQPVGPVPESDRGLLGDVLAEQAVTDGPPTRADLVEQRGLGMDDLAVRSAMRMIRRSERAEAGDVDLDLREHHTQTTTQGRAA